MKKIKKLFKKLNNNGSSMVMVIVALAFIGIIVGALLSAVGYSYRLKLQDLNSRDNFYYVEQAMNEIYAGVGSEVVGDMQDAYTYTVENMVKYDFETKAYVTKSHDEVQELFAEEFMKYVMNNPLLVEANLASTLESYITNDSVVLDRSKIYLDVERDLSDNNKVKKITIKNVTLTRTMDYDKNVASGSYTQTISTDIEIGEPDFEVLFNATTDDYANIFKYSMVADMGVEVVQPTTPLTITGNVYAAADYYNKKYNESTYVVDEDGNYTVSDNEKVFTSGESYEIVETDKFGNNVSSFESPDDMYTHGSVTSKLYSPSTLFNEYYNQYSTATNPAVAGSNDLYDGVLERSMYSGLYVDGSNVTVMADMLIVPGTVAVMNEGTLSVYGKNGSLTAESEIWADNVVLAGTSEKEIDDDDEVTYNGSSAIFKSSLYVKDDTEINAAGSKFSMNGSYYGYGDSTERDERIFIPTVDANNFQVQYYQGGELVTDNRGHYNSSAIIINGQQSTLDLEQTETIYLAGRSYIELSKEVTANETVVGEGDDAKTVISETYSFLPETNKFVTTTDTEDTEYLRDYKTGESISLKTNQLAYIPVMYSGMPEAVYEDGVFQGYFEAELHVALKDSALFLTYFPVRVFEDYKIPCVMQEVSGKKYYYYDFREAYDMICYNTNGAAYDTFVAAYPSAQYYAAAFITDYVAELNDENSLIAEYLTDIGDFEELEFDAGDIILPDYELNPNVRIYSSGAITTKYDTEFKIIQSDDWNQTELASLLLSTNNNYNNGLDLETMESVQDRGYYSDAYKLSNDLEMEYNLVKWNLGHYDITTGDTNKDTRTQHEIEYIRKLCMSDTFGEASITPINKFLNMDEITSSTSISPAINAGDAGSNILDLDSGYSVWVTDEDVIVKARDEDKGVVRGVIVTKGDVFFDKNVISFEGLIVAGGKVFITENLSKMYSSPAICQAVLRECQLLGTDNAKTVLNLFKGYEVDETEEGGTEVASPTDSSKEAKTIDNIDYSDVCRFSNWMKNVE